jgi:hypothetical protein
MQTILIVVTLASLAMTIVLAVILARLIRFERRRSAARADLLREMADAATAPGALELVIDEPPDVRLRDDADAAATAAATDLFAQPEVRSAWPRRIAVAAALAVIAAGATFALRTSGERGAVPAASARAAAVSAQQGRLELLSLKETQGANALTITGLVQNPTDGTELSKVAATALLFAADGSYLASGRAPLDFTVLRPGDESGFVITVPINTPVARYRIGFRGEDGHVIGHVDRRTASTLAAGAAGLAAPRRGMS